ncbi:MAG: leucyl aminopeptidase [Alphaproteobacteria bacterium]|nr:MAG: leucyl aminopeptidase [Alphaproteobacteria bacterium]
MTIPADFSFTEVDVDRLATAEGSIALLVPEDGRMSVPARRLNRLMKGALARFLEGDGFSKLKPGEAATLAWPTGLLARAVIVARVPARPSVSDAREAGAAIAKAAGQGPMTLLVPSARLRPAEAAYGLGLRAYAFDSHKTSDGKVPGPVEVQTPDPATAEEVFARYQAVMQGVFLTRNLVNEPANVLTTTEFANRLEALSSLGLGVEVLDEPELEELGMRALLAVGQGSESPSKVVVMQWRGGAEDEPPVAIVGKGVVFDTGGISIKPAQGMEEMTMDMGGAGVVAGLMKAVALRKAPVNVVGVVGLVENMPDGRAQRPGDIVRTMKGDTVEVINTDAEGRLVLCDILWYAQERFAPRAVVDLATLTGAIIIALGHENAGVFANDDKLAERLLTAAADEGEGAWRMPVGAPYDEQLKSDYADVKNVGGRPAGSITAAEFLRRFIKEGTPWAHIDIAGVARIKKDRGVFPKGATGWGVRTLDRLLDLLAEG